GARNPWRMAGLYFRKQEKTGACAPVLITLQPQFGNAAVNRPGILAIHDVVKIGPPAVGAANRNRCARATPVRGKCHQLVRSHDYRACRLTSTADGDRARTAASVEQVDAHQSMWGEECEGRAGGRVVVVG